MNPIEQFRDFTFNQDQDSESEEIQQRVGNMRQQVQALQFFHHKGLIPPTILFIGPASTGKTETINELVGRLTFSSASVHVLQEGGRMYWSNPEMRAHEPPNPLYHRVRIAHIYMDQLMDSLRNHRDARLWLADNSPFNSFMIGLSSNPSLEMKTSIAEILDLLRPLADIYTKILLFHPDNTVFVRDQVRRETNDEDRKRIYQSMKDVFSYLNVPDDRIIEIKEAISERPQIARDLISAYVK